MKITHDTLDFVEDGVGVRFDEDQIQLVMTLVAFALITGLLIGGLRTA